MKIKDSKTKYMKMDRIIQVGVVSLGAMLVTGVAVEVDKQKEALDNLVGRKKEPLR